MGGLKRATVISATKRILQSVLMLMALLYLYGSYIFQLFYARKLNHYLKDKGNKDGHISDY